MPLSPPLIRLKIWTGPPLSRCNMCELWGISSWVLQYMEGIKELRCCNTWGASKSSDTAIRLQRRLILWANNQRRALMAIRSSGLRFKGTAGSHKPRVQPMSSQSTLNVKLLRYFKISSKVSLQNRCLIQGYIKSLKSRNIHPNKKTPPLTLF